MELFKFNQYWTQHRNDEVVAWYPINEIEFYQK